MKKILIILLLIIIPNTSYAQSQDCSSINPLNQFSCCTGTSSSINKNSCDNYDRSIGKNDENTINNSNTNNTTTSNQSWQSDCNSPFLNNEEKNNMGCNQAPGQIGGGNSNTQNTNAINSGTQNSNPVVNSINSSSDSSCSARFLSLIDILIWIKCIITTALIPLIFAGAFMFFLWGVMRFIMATDSTKREEGKKNIIWGLVGLFVMVSMWGIIKIFTTLFGVETVVPALQTTYLKK